MGRQKSPNPQPETNHVAGETKRGCRKKISKEKTAADERREDGGQPDGRKKR